MPVKPHEAVYLVQARRPPWGASRLGWVCGSESKLHCGRYVAYFAPRCIRSRALSDPCRRVGVGIGAIPFRPLPRTLLAARSGQALNHVHHGATPACAPKPQATHENERLPDERRYHGTGESVSAWLKYSPPPPCRLLRFHRLAPGAVPASSHKCRGRQESVS
jgi:hypothetical protein